LGRSWGRKTANKNYRKNNESIRDVLAELELFDHVVVLRVFVSIDVEE